MIRYGGRPRRSMCNQGNTELARTIDRYSRFEPTSLSIKKLVDFGSLQPLREDSSYNFLRYEIPVRFANIMKEFKVGPSKLLETRSAQVVLQSYNQCLMDIVAYEDKESTVETLKEFTKTIIDIRNRNRNAVQTMAEGVADMRSSLGITDGATNLENFSKINENITYFLDRFYLSRIGIRMLINQHTLLFSEDPVFQHGFVGSIDPNCDVADVVKGAFEDAKDLCDRDYLDSPKLEIKILNKNEDKVTMTCVPSHLYHIIFELIKNAMRATMEFNGLEDSPPPVEVSICKGDEDVTVVVSDRGGGIPRRQMGHIWEYMYTTAPLPAVDNGVGVPMAGYGYGLPISRLYARYLHGDLQLVSMEGYGTKAIIYLRVFGEHADELLPIYNTTVKNYYSTATLPRDWTRDPLTDDWTQTPHH